MQGFDKPQSSVHQMIMGAGKTHVVTPLLALLLADAKSLVTVVVPRSLLELSRSKLRETFSSVIPKFVFTLNFERLPQLHCDMDHLSSDGMSEYSAAAKLGHKLDRIRSLSGVCITTPDAVKSVELTFIDMLYSRDRVREDPFGPAAEKLMKMKEVTQSLHDVLSLWREHGLALFDEASVLGASQFSLFLIL
jgi:superfamily II DNA or RNA helicase